MNRWWHIVPVLITGGIWVWLYRNHASEFFGTTKDSFNAIGSLLGGLGLAATFLEVARAGATISAISSDRDMTAARARLVEIRRVVEEVRGVHKLLDAGSKVGSATVSDITGMLCALVEPGFKFEGFPLADLDKDLQGLAGRPSKAARDIGVASLGRVRRLLEEQQQNAQRTLDRFIGVRK